MKLFKVLGARQELFYMDVRAKDKMDAYDIAESFNTENWFELETDNVIEVIEVEEVDENE